MLQIKPDVNRIQTFRKVTINKKIWPSSPGGILDKDLIDLAATAFTLFCIAGSIRKVFAGAMDNAIGKKLPTVTCRVFFTH